MTRLKWKLISVRLEIVLMLSQDRCIVWIERIIGSKSFWMHPMELLGDVVMWNLVLNRLEIVLVLVQDRCTVFAKCTIGSDIVLDAPGGTPR